ncbi:uncharacterized protein [Dendropsophus ebraccatus]|uniref:uncharacterized protein n=1 Tax=Dendropsophus ebraccatus TaxID=150705 RepID=UPI0038316F8A
MKSSGRSTKTLQRHHHVFLNISEPRSIAPWKIKYAKILQRHHHVFLNVSELSKPSSEKEPAKPRGGSPVKETTFQQATIKNDRTWKISQQAPKMMKIVVILYNLLLHSSASGEPAVKEQICSDVLDNAITDSLNQMEPSELRDHIGDFRTESSRGKNPSAHGNGRNQPTVLPITNVQMEHSPGSQILSNNSFETGFEIRIKYGEKTYRRNGPRRPQSSYLFLDMDIVAVLRFKVNEDEIVYNLHRCEVSVRNRDTNLNQNSDLQPRKSRLCGIVRRIIDNMNENWDNSLVIDPSGNTKLVLKSISQNSTDCLQLNLNLVVGGSEVISGQKHGVLPGSGISLLNDYINHLLLADVQFIELNKELKEKNLQLSPDELQKIINDVYETNPTNLFISVIAVPRLDINNVNETMKVVAALQAFSLKSEKSIFDVTFEIKIKIKFLLEDNKLTLQFLSFGDPVIRSWESSVGTTGNLDNENLKILLKKITSGTLLDALTNLRLSYRIPFWTLASAVKVKSETIEIFPEET